MLGHEGHDDGLVLASLGLVDGDGVGQGDVHELVPLVAHRPAVEVDEQRPPGLVGLEDGADVAVEDVLVVVVADLHDLVARPERARADLKALPAGVEAGLELGVEVVDADDPLVHGADDLDLRREGAQAQLGGDARGAHLEDRLEGLPLVVLADEVEIGVPVVPGRVDGRQALVDPVRVDDDEALLLLPEDLVQPDDVDRPRLDDVVEQVPRPDRGELVLVADDDEPHPGGDGLEQVEQERQVDHRELVDDEGLPGEGVPLVPLERPLPGLELEDAVDGPGLPAGGLGQPLGRPARRGGQQDLLAPLAEDVDDGPDDGRLARPRAAGDDQDLALERLPDGLPLEGREPEPEFSFRVGDGLVEIEIRRPAGEPGQPVDGPNDLLLGLVKKGQVEGPAPGRVLGDDFLVLDEGGQARLGPVGGDLEVGRAPLQDLRLEREHVALLVVLPEDIEDVGLDPVGRGRVHAELEGDLVGGLEADAEDVEAELVGIGLENGERPVAVLAVDLRGQARRDAVLLEEHDQVPDVPVLGPGPPDLPELDGAHPADLAEALRLPAQDVDRRGAEGRDDALGQHGADPPDQARGQELLDALGRGGQGHGEAVHLELPAEARADLPRAADAQDLAGRERRERADDGHRLALLGQEPGDRVAVVGVVEDDVVDGALDRLLPGDERRLLHASLMMTPCYAFGRTGSMERREGSPQRATAIPEARMSSEPVNETAARREAEGVVGASLGGDLAGPEPGEGSFRGNRPNVFERGLAQAERVVWAPSPANGAA